MSIDPCLVYFEFFLGALNEGGAVSQQLSLLKSAKYWF
jgi:hypothetical protein